MNQNPTPQNPETLNIRKDEYQLLKALAIDMGLVCLHIKKVGEKLDSFFIEGKNGKAPSNAQIIAGLTRNLGAIKSAGPALSNSAKILSQIAEKYKSLMPVDEEDESSNAKSG